MDITFPHGNIADADLINGLQFMVGKNNIFFVVN